mgnify:CR=1 FL=1
MTVRDVERALRTALSRGGDWAELEFEATPWSDPAYFREISPITYAERIHTPLLIQHGENDPRVSIAGAWRFYRALKSLELANNTDFTIGKHAMRAGVLSHARAGRSPNCR